MNMYDILPCTYHATITPSNTVEVKPRPRAIWIGGAGDIVIRDDKGADVTYTIPSGALPYRMDFRGKFIMATGTTATSIVAWW